MRFEEERTVTENPARVRGSRDRWGQVARDVLVTFVLGCLLSALAIDDVVRHADPEDDVAALAFLIVVLTYALSGLVVLLFLLVGLVRRLETASIVALALLDLAVGVWWAYWARPSDPGCLAGCGSGGHGPMPTGALVLLWVTAAVHIVTAAAFALRVRPHAARAGVRR